MTDHELTSPHAGANYRVPWGSDCLLWLLRKIPGRIRPLTLLGGALPGTVPGMDVSHWQGDLTKEWWDAAYTEGYRFVFFEGTEGIDFTDPNYATNKANAKETGFKANQALTAKSLSAKRRKTAKGKGLGEKLAVARKKRAKK